MAKLTDFETPTGVKGNLLNPTDLLKMVLGGFVMIFTFAAAQNLAGKVSSRVPAIDTTIEKPYRDPQPTNTSRKVVL